LIRYIFTALLVLLSGCTENPFFTDKIDPKNQRTIYGRVALSDNSVPDGIFIWLEGFDLSTYSDENGRFEITLPLPQEQPAGGINGVFNLYYFAGNYRLASTTLHVLDGQFRYGQGDVNASGEIYPWPVLRQLLQVECTLAPNSIIRDFNQEISVQCTLSTTLDSVFVESYLLREKEFSSILLISTNPSVSDTILYKLPAAGLQQSVVKNLEIWHMNFDTKQVSFNSDRYEIIPFLLVRQEGIPPGLISALGNAALTFSPEYTDLPFKRQPGAFTVTESF